MNDFSELVNLRESVRRYKNTPVEKEKILKIIESCRLAPSACNSQPWKFIIVDNPDLKEKIAKTSYGPLLRFNKFASQAPVIAVLVIEKPTWLAKIGGGVKNKDFPVMDNGIISSYFCLQAAELGLGTCMIGWFDEDKVRSLLDIPKNKRVSLLITLGYPAKDRRKKIRKNIKEICAFNNYNS